MRGWIKLDDGMPENPKIAELSDSAFRAYVCSIAYSARQMTDGFVPEVVARSYANGSLGELWNMGLWEEHPGGYMIHDYLDYQRSKADIEQLKNDRKAAGSKGGKASSRAKDKQVLKQNASKPQAEQEQEQELSTSTSSEIQRIYDHWRAKRGKTRANYARLSPGRRAKIQARLREFSEQELCAAIDNVAHDPWPDRSRHDDLTVLFRSREQVDRFLEMRSTQATPRTNAAAYRIGGAR